MLKKALIFLAPGFEEMEAIAPIDVLRRAGIEVVVAGIRPDADGCVCGSRHVRVRCDSPATAVVPQEYDLVYFPGGMPGAANLAADPGCLEAARVVHAQGGLVCAICAAPIVLSAAGLLTSGVEYTCYPGFEKQIPGATYTGRFIQKSGRILTACGPAAALEFALEILRASGSTQLATQLAQGMRMRNA